MKPCRNQVLHEMQAQGGKNILNEKTRGEMCNVLPVGKRKNQQSIKN